MSEGATNPNRFMPTIEAAQYNQPDNYRQYTPLFFGDSGRSGPKEDTTVKAGATKPGKQGPFQVRAEAFGFLSGWEKE